MPRVSKLLQLFKESQFLILTLWNWSATLTGILASHLLLFTSSLLPPLLAVSDEDKAETEAWGTSRKLLEDSMIEETQTFPVKTIQPSVYLQ